MGCITSKNSQKDKTIEENFKLINRQNEQHKVMKKVLENYEIKMLEHESFKDKVLQKRKEELDKINVEKEKLLTNISNEKSEDDEVYGNYSNLLNLFKNKYNKIVNLNENMNNEESTLCDLYSECNTSLKNLKKEYSETIEQQLNLIDNQNNKLNFDSDLNQQEDIDNIIQNSNNDIDVLKSKIVELKKQTKYLDEMITNVQNLSISRIDKINTCIGSRERIVNFIE